MAHFNEDVIEQAALEWLREVGYKTLHGDTIAPGEPAAERASFNDVLLLERFRAALTRINGHIPASARAETTDEVVRKVMRSATQNLLVNNHDFHRLLTEGVDVSYRASGQIKHDKVWLVDFHNPGANDWLAVNQFTIIDRNAQTQVKTNRRPDIILFINGLPLVVIELKNAADEQATIKKAFHQLQTYQDDIAPLFTYNALLAVSDGPNARLGTLSAGWEWFKQWRTVDGAALDPANLETLIKGVFARERLLDLIRYFIVFEQNGSKLTKKVAAYHQYHAVNKAVQKTVEATRIGGNKKVGVVWHTQGSGKSLSMLFYTGKIIQHPALENPTLIILTDRNDLDDQLFGTFAAGQELLRQEPVQSQNRAHLRELLQVASGGVVFTTIQKFTPDGQDNVYPLLSDRRNIIFIADEAHRSQYGFEARVIKGENASEAHIAYGFAKYVRDALPNASFIGFTGTPVELTDANTRQVFGDYIDIYDIKRAVDDGATVPIHYEGRLARIKLRDELRPMLDPSFEEVTEGEELTTKEKLKSKWSQLEAMVGTSERLAQVAQDIVTHFETRLTSLDGKGMIVTMSRRIAVELYDAIIKIRPEWHANPDDQGAIKVVMTGSASDIPQFQPHVRSKARRKALSDRFKDPADPMKLVIVRDMWLTGFDAPPLHTMYVDKPMQGHSLMQAIARVNRVFGNKPGGRIVDYLGIATDLQAAVTQYTAAGSDRPIIPIAEAVALMLTEYSVAQAFFHQFDYSAFHTGTPTARLQVITRAMEHILKQDSTSGEPGEVKKRFMETVTRLSRAFALSIPDEQALAIRDEVAFFQVVRATFAKTTGGDEGRDQEDLDSAIKQLVSEAVTSPDVINILEAAGLKVMDVSILSDEFLEDVSQLPQKNLALELLRKLLNDEIKTRSGKNAVQARSFADMLEKTILRYQNRSIDAAQVIAELIEIAKEIRESNQRGAELGLSEAEMAFYDALAANENAKDVMGNKQLALIAVELVQQVRSNVTIDWTVKQSARAKIRVLVKRILRRYGYPPNLEEKATDLVLEQAELLAAQWVA